MIRDARTALILTSLLLPSLAMPAGAASPDGNVEWNGVSHIAWQDRRPVCPVDGESFQVRFQTWANDLTAARIQVDDGSLTWVNAAVIETRGPYDVWAAQVPSTASLTESYFIELTDGADVDYLSVSGMSDATPVDGGFALNFTTLEHAPVGATLVNGGATVFRVWAPAATSANVRGSFNGWSLASPMTKVGDYFIARIVGAANQNEYKYYFDNSIWKTDARGRALNPAGGNDNSKIVNPFLFTWALNDFPTPALEEMVIYQLHVGTFAGGNDPIPGAPHPARFSDLAIRAAHLAELGVNTVMLNPINEFNGEESAGYNPQAPWAVESTYGTPDALRNMVDALHAQGIAVLVDIVWNHFDSFNNFMWFYDGSQIYFDSPAVGTPWGDQADFDDPQVRDFYLASALYWLEEYRIDGFRMDATDFMDNAPHDLSGWSLMQDLNDMVDNRWASKVVIAEELPDDQGITTPTNFGGAGFDSQYHDAFTDRLREEIADAAFGDPEMWKIRDIINGSGTWLNGRHVMNYVELHDEAWPTSGGQRLVKTIDTTAPHDDQWAKGRSKLAQGVVLFAPGVPAMLMGTEWLESIDFGTDAASKIDWSKKTTYAGIFDYYKAAIALRTSNPALRADASNNVYHLNEGGNVIGWRRWDGGTNDFVIVANFSNTDYTNYRIGLPQAGDWEEVLNSQDPAYEGSGPTNPGVLASEATSADGMPQSVVLNVPKMALIVLSRVGSTVGVPGPGSGAASSLRLAPVRPTPSRGAATVRFTLPRDAHVRLTVHDARGRRIATLVDGARGAGEHAAHWNGVSHTGGRVASGVYFLRLEADGEFVSRKLPLMR